MFYARRKVIFAKIVKNRETISKVLRYYSRYYSHKLPLLVTQNTFAPLPAQSVFSVIRRGKKHISR